MKKSLVALAVLAATGAYAQSSVTLYGIVEATTDIAYKRDIDNTTTRNTFNAAGNGLTSTVSSSNSTQKNGFRVQDGSDQGTGTSRIGFRGTEDLGSGLKANFVLEMGLRIDDGCTTLTAAGGCDNGGNSANSGGSTFGRNAWGGLSGGFGEVRLGRQVLGSYGVQANTVSAGAGLGLYESSAALYLPMGGVRFSNAIKYLSPNFGGFTANVTLAAPETVGPTSGTSTAANGAVTSNSTSRRTGVDLALEYANGPAYVGFGYNKRDTGFGTSSTTPVAGLFPGSISAINAPGTATAYTLGGAYDLGVVKPFINYTRQKTDLNGSSQGFVGVAPGTNTFNSTTGDTTARALSIGLRAPVGAFTVLAGYGRVVSSANTVITAISAAGITSTNTGRLDERRNSFQLGAQYALSKRTLLEANYGYTKLRSNGTSVDIGNIVPVGRTETLSNGNDRISAFNVGLKHSF